MATKEEVQDVLSSAHYIALASVNEGEPNVRIIDIAYDKALNNIQFIAHKMSPKTKEFKAHNKVAFTTLPPMGPGLTLRCNDATISESSADIDLVKKVILEKHPQIENMFNAFGENAQVFEISFNEVRVFERGQESVVAF